MWPRRLSSLAPLAGHKTSCIFLDENLGKLTFAEIGAALGRSANAVKIKFTRRGMIAPSKRRLTGQMVAKILNVDIHNVMRLAQRGILPVDRVPGERGIMAIRKRTLYRWAVNPMHWIYFKASVDNPERISDPHLRRLIIRQKERWKDEWLTPGQVAELHGVHHTDVNRLIHRGEITGTKWGNWWILRSEATRPDLIFYKGRGSAPSPYAWSERAELFLVRARLEWGLQWNAIDQLMKKNRTDSRFHQLKHTGRLAELMEKYGIRAALQKNEADLDAEYRIEKGQQTMDKLIEAIRRHPLVGENTCSFVDETMTDAGLSQELKQAGVTTVNAAIRHVLEVESVTVSRQMDSYPDGAPDWLARRYDALQDA